VGETNESRKNRFQMDMTPREREIIVDAQEKLGISTMTGAVRAGVHLVGLYAQIHADGCRLAIIDPDGNVRQVIMIVPA
jgi:hypothetical protein